MKHSKKYLTDYTLIFRGQEIWDKLDEEGEVVDIEFSPTKKIELSFDSFDLDYWKSILADEHAMIIDAHNDEEHCDFWIWNDQNPVVVDRKGKKLAEFDWETKDWKFFKSSKQ
jgi:hypothetical protein